jgi:hypothetical protein
MLIKNARLYEIVILAAALAVASTAAFAQSACSQRDNVIGHLAKKYKEVPIAIGVTNKGGLIEVLSAGQGETWTIIISTPDGRSCMIAAGEGWRRKQDGAVSTDPRA